jgi:GTP-binding protein
VNRKNLARTSNVPGKTQQMNYYALPDELFLVDLPGYGFAKVPKKERERWGRSIRKYLMERPTLRLVIHVVDSRHEPTQLDEDFFYWMATNELPFIVVLSKADKLSANKRAQAVSRTRKVLKEMNIEVPVLPTSAGGEVGVEALKTMIEEFTLT